MCSRQRRIGRPCFWIGVFLANISINDVAARVGELIGPILDDLGLELVLIEYLSITGRWTLRIFVDKDGGVTLDDCSVASRQIGDALDVDGALSHGYVLEISSPGLDRPLIREKDYINSIGKKIRVRTGIPTSGSRNFKGTLRVMDGKRLDIETDSGIISIPFDNIQKANLIYEADKL